MKVKEADFRRHEPGKKVGALQSAGRQGQGPASWPGSSRKAQLGAVAKADPQHHCGYPGSRQPA